MSTKLLLKPLMACIFALLPFMLFSQTEDLTQDEAFFKERAQLYQRWLDHAGFGTVLKVQEVTVKPARVSLYLAFHATDLDTINAAWTSLKESYERKGFVTLEQELFYKMINLLDVPQTMGDVQIYDTYDLALPVLFFRGIAFKDGSVKVDSSGDRSKIRDIAFRPADFRNMKSLQLQEFQQRFDRGVVYDKIIACARRRFEVKRCEDRNPRVVVLENGEVLRFEVTDLCREVLIDEANPTLCQLLQGVGYPCNWVKRELLIFTIKHQTTADGFQLKIELDGRYGSGMYSNVRRGGYMNMEIDFDEYLERYANIFREYLRTCIR